MGNKRFDDGFLLCCKLYEFLQILIQDKDEDEDIRDYYIQLGMQASERFEVLEQAIDYIKTYNLSMEGNDK